MARSWVLIAVFLLASGGSRAAEPGMTNSAAGYRGSKRFLIVLETSSGMRRRADATLQIVQQLFVSGMGGQLRSGDTIGIWTYGQKLTTGKFPLQQWSAATSNSVIAEALAFVRDQNYSRDGDLQVLTPALQGVVAKSDLITVILLSDGTQKFSGVPFESEINRVYGEWSEEQAQRRQPFVTIFRGHKGAVTHARAAPAPWKVELPPLPVQPPLVSAPPPAERKAPPIGKPLIVKGPKPQPVLAAPDTNPPTAEPLRTASLPEMKAPEEPTPPPPNEAKLERSPATPPPETPETKEAESPPEPVTDGGTSLPPQQVEPAPAAQAAALPPERRTLVMVWPVAGLFLVIIAALVVVVVLSRRKSQSSSGSLITESYDHEHDGPRRKT